MYRLWDEGGILLTSGAQLSLPVVHEPESGSASWFSHVHGPSGELARATWMLKPLPLVAKAYHVPSHA